MLRSNKINISVQLRQRETGVRNENIPHNPTNPVKPIKPQNLTNDLISLWTQIQSQVRFNQ